MSWRKAKIKYDCLIQGELKTITEFYLHDGVSFRDVEDQIFEAIQSRIKNPDIDAIAKIKYNQVVFHAMQEDDAFYQVKVTGFDEKKLKWVYLVPALDYEQAGDRIREFMKGTLIPWEITHVDKTDILAVWMPHNEIWQGDYYNRMDRYYDEGKYEAGHNQMDINFNRSEDDDVVPSDPKAVTAMVVRNGVVDTVAEDLGNGYDGPAGTMEPVKELGPGVYALPSGEDEETPSDYSDYLRTN